MGTVSQRGAGPNLHNNQREREHQQDGEFIEYKCREHVKTCNIVTETCMKKE